MILYHGTRNAALDAFTEDGVGRGAEPNSELGVWLTRDPHAAAAYCGDRRVLIVEIDAPRLAVARDKHVAIWGDPEVSSGNWRFRAVQGSLFAAARERLRAEGFDGVWCEMSEEDMAGAVCVFDPSRLRVVGALDYPENRDLDEMADPADDSEVDFGADLETVLDEIRAGPTASPEP